MKNRIPDGTDLQTFVQMLKQNDSDFEVIDIGQAFVVMIQPADSNFAICAVFRLDGQIVDFEVLQNDDERAAKFHGAHKCRVCAGPCASYPGPQVLKWADELREAAKFRRHIHPKTLEQIATYLEGGRLPQEER